MPGKKQQHLNCCSTAVYWLAEVKQTKALTEWLPQSTIGKLRVQNPGGCWAFHAVIQAKAFMSKHTIRGMACVCFPFSTCAYVLEKFCVDNSFYEGWYGKWQQFIETCSWGPIEQSKVNFLYVFWCQSMWLHDLWPRVLSVTSSKRDEKTSIPLEDNGHSSFHLCSFLEPSARHEAKSMS